MAVQSLHEASGLDIHDVRGSFPALAQDQIFMDNAGGSQTLGVVIDSIRDYLSNSNVQLGASYRTSQQSTDLYSQGYAAAAKYINASPGDIVLGSSTSQLFRNLSFALDIAEGDEIVVSKVDHEANIAPWTDLAKRQKLTLKEWMPEPAVAPKLTVENLKPLLSNKTRLVTLTHSSNILGTIHDVKAIAEAVHAANPRALVCVDGVAYAPHRSLDMKDLGVDFYAFSWYKVYGPHISMLYASPTGLEAVNSMGHHFNPHKTLENKLGLAGSSYELVASLPRVVDYLEGKSAAIEKLEGILQSVVLEYLNSRNDVTIHGEKLSDSRLRVPTISFSVKGRDSKELVEKVEKASNLGFRWGHFYSYSLVKGFGLGDSGVVRVSMVHYNTVEEARTFVAALDAALKD